LKITSNAPVTLVRAEQDCFKELFEAVDITRRISEFICMAAVSSRPSDQRPEKPDDRMCWVDSEAQWAGVGWRKCELQLTAFFYLIIGISHLTIGIGR